MKKALFLTALLLLLCASAFFLFRSWLRQGEISVHKTVRFEGREEIVIKAGEINEPLQITLRSDEEFYRALGFAQSLVAGDRMVFLRMCAAGRLSETFGDGYEQMDDYLRSWQFTVMARETAQSLDEKTLTVLNEFTDGINQRFNTLPPPSGCLIYRVDSGRWTPEDVLAIWHLLRWSQLENWPLTFLVRYAEIYYGRQVKEQFETVLKHKIPSFPAPEHIRDFEEVFKVGRDLRDLTGLKMLLKEHALTEGRFFSYGGIQNEDWLEMNVEIEAETMPVLVHAGLPLVFGRPERTIIPYKREFVPLIIPPEDDDTSPFRLQIQPRLPGKQASLFQISPELFDISGDIFTHIMMEDTLDGTLLDSYSYVLHKPPGGENSFPPAVRGETEKELEKELLRILAGQKHAYGQASFTDPMEWGMLTAFLMDQVYRDDLTVIHSVFSGWSGLFPDFFLGHLLMLMKNPYSAWWDNRETAEITENKKDVIFTLLPKVRALRSLETPFEIPDSKGYPLSRYHLLTGSYRVYPKELINPLLIRNDKNRLILDRYTYMPDFLKELSQNP